MFGFKKVDHAAEFVKGPGGQQVLRSIAVLADHFKAIDGWAAETMSVPELAYLAAFNAWVTIRTNSRHFLLTTREAAEVGAGLIQALSLWYGDLQHLTPDEIEAMEKRGFNRVLEYDQMWMAGIEEKDQGAFLLHVYTCVQRNHDPALRVGFLDHFVSFIDTQRRLAMELKAVGR